MRAACIALVIGTMSCGGGRTATGPAEASGTVQQIALAPKPEPAEAASPKRPDVANIVDEERPHTLDGHLPNPGTATLQAVSEREARLAFSVVEGQSYDAIVNLESGCVVETVASSNSRLFATLYDAPTDEQVRANLGSEDVQRAVGTHLALLARFAQNEIAAVMVRGHSDGVAAVSKDHKKLALSTRGKVFLSVDGGRSFSRADLDSAAVVEALQFSGDDRYLMWSTFTGNRRPMKQEHAILDTTAPLPAETVKVSTEHFYPLRASSPQGQLLFTHETDRCIYGIDPAAPAMKQVTCIPGPKIQKDHFFYVTLSPSGRTGMEMQGDFQATRGFVFSVDGKTATRQLKGAYELHNAHVGPDDEGRFAWENRYDTLRIDSPGGVRDTPMRGTPVGFDLQGNVLVFQQPPLVRPHKPMTMMPPAKGTLEDTKCTLLRRVTPKEATK